MTMVRSLKKLYIRILKDEEDEEKRKLWESKIEECDNILVKMVKEKIRNSSGTKKNT